MAAVSPAGPEPTMSSFVSVRPPPDSSQPLPAPTARGAPIGLTASASGTAAMSPLKSIVSPSNGFVPLVEAAGDASVSWKGELA